MEASAGARNGTCVHLGVPRSTRGTPVSCMIVFQGVFLFIVSTMYST